MDELKKKNIGKSKSAKCASKGVMLQNETLKSEHRRRYVFKKL